jgi:integrase
MKSAIRDQFISEHSRCSPETLRVMLFWCDRWLDFAGDDHWDKNMVNEFRSRLEREGYAPLTVRTALGVVKRCFDAASVVFEAERRKAIAGVDPSDPAAVAQVLKAISVSGPVWDLGKRWLPRGESVTKRKLSLEDVTKLVETAKAGGLEPPEAAFLALGSIYGLRVGELRQVRREHIDFDENTIFILTEKGGERRRQLLCPEIIPYLKNYDFHWEYSPFLMNAMYKTICEKAGLEDRLGEKWHALRALALTAVRDNLARVSNQVPFNLDHVLAAKIFFRWRLSSSGEMVDRYYTPQNVLEIDRFVLEHHPVVAFWRLGV